MGKKERKKGRGGGGGGVVCWWGMNIPWLSIAEWKKVVSIGMII